MDIGLEGPEDYEALRQILETAHVVEELWKRLPPTDPTELSPAGSDLAKLLDRLPDPLVDIRLSLSQGLISAAGCLSQIAGFVEKDIPTTAVVLQTLARTALLAASRVVFVLGPNSAAERERHAKIVLRQESRSLMRLYNEAEKFQSLSGLVPPAHVLEQQRARAEVVDRSAPPQGEATTLQEMAVVTGRLLEASGYVDEDDGVVFTAQHSEHVSWTFNVYSGVAHGFAWPRLIPGTESMPGHFLVEMTMVANTVHLAFDLMRQRTATD